MGKKRVKNAGRKQAVTAVKEFISSPAAIAVVESAHPASETVATLVSEIATIHSELTSLDDIIGFALDATKAGEAAGDGWRILHHKVRAAKQQAQAKSSSATHRAKRQLVDALGINCSPRSLAEFIANQPLIGEPTSYLRPRIVFRKRQSDPGKQGVTLADTKCRPNDDLVADENNGFYVVYPGESVIFVDPDPLKVELAALRGILLGTSFSQELYEHLQHVVATACNERRDVRPRHDGKMVQVGWNSGPFHARMFGLAVSFTKKLDLSTATHHDADAIGAMTLTWNIAQAFLPSEVITATVEAVGDIGLPKLATRNVGEGTGYRISIGSREYDFPLHERAPCEGLFTQNYASPTHIDVSHAPYTFSWTAVREPDVAQLSQLEPVRVLRSGRSSQPGEDPAKWPSYGGGNFVDVSLRVKVIQEAGTLLVHCPDFLHGTTRLCGISAAGMTIPFTLRIKEQFELMKARETCGGDGVDDIDPVD